jgi:hypothetical protein
VDARNVGAVGVNNSPLVDPPMNARSIASTTVGDTGRAVPYRKRVDRHQVIAVG